MGGIGSGIGSGGPRPNAGRRKGGRDRRTVARLVQAEKSGAPSPLEFLTAVMLDENLPMPQRITAALGAAPYHHARLSPQRVLPPVTTMDDAALLHLFGQIEARIGKASAADRSRALADQADQLMEGLSELTSKRQEDLLTQLIRDSQTRLHQLRTTPQPGDVVPRQPVIEHAPIAAPSPGPTWGDGMPNGSATAPPARSAQREIKYERDAIGKLVRVN